jgi:hypothetical protein
MRVVGWYEVLQHFGGASGAYAFGAEQIFDGDGNAGQRADVLTGGDALIEGIGAFAGIVAGNGDESFNLRFNFFDALEKIVGDFAARDFFLLDLLRDLVGGEFY